MTVFNNGKSLSTSATKRATSAPLHSGAMLCTSHAAFASARAREWRRDTAGDSERKRCKSRT